MHRGSPQLRRENEKFSCRREPIACPRRFKRQYLVAGLRSTERHEINGRASSAVCTNMSSTCSLSRAASFRLFSSGSTKADRILIPSCAVQGWFHGETACPAIFCFLNPKRLLLRSVLVCDLSRNIAQNAAQNSGRVGRFTVSLFSLLGVRSTSWLQGSESVNWLTGSELGAA